MRTLRFRGDRCDDLLGFLSCYYGLRAKKIKEMHGEKVGFFVFDKYYLRINSYVSCSIFYHQDEKDTCEITIVGAGGAQGFIGVTWGTEHDIETFASKPIIKYTTEELQLEKIEDRKEHGD